MVIIFGGFENNAIWRRLNLAIILEERGGGWVRYFVYFNLVKNNFGKIF